MHDWFNGTVSENWMEGRQKMMSLLTEEAALEEIVNNTLISPPCLAMVLFNSPALLSIRS